MQKREYGIDLLRCVALLFVTGVHSFLYNGFYSENQIGIIMWGANSARWMFYCCNCLYMMLTGYLRGGKPFSKGYYHSLVPILIGYALTCVISFPIRHFCLGEKLTLYQWLEKLVTFANYGWYVEMYIGLFLLSPLLNILLEKMQTLKQYLWLLGTMLILTALPSLTSADLAPDYWNGLYPLTLYILGAGIRRYQPKLPSWLSALLALATVTLLGLISLLSTDKNFSSGFTQGYGGFWVTLTGTFVFLAIYRLQLPGKLATCANWLAGGCFEGYLLSRLFDVWVYAAAPASWRQPERYWLCFVAITIPIFLISILAGKAVHTLAVKLTDLILPKKKAQAVK